MTTNYPAPPPSYSENPNPREPLLGSEWENDVPDDFKYGVSVMQCDASIRNAFVSKVYSILGFQLLFSIIAGALFMYNEGVKDWVQENQWLMWVSMGGSFVSLFALYWKSRSYPTNYVLLGVFTFCESYMIGAALTVFEKAMVLQALIITFGIFAGLTLFTMQSKYDFSGMGPFLLGGLLLFIFIGLVQLFIPFSRILDLIMAVGIAILFCGFIIYDTYNLMNTLSPEDYVIASISLYLDFINLFLAILRILNDGLYENEAGINDWHNKFVGTPKLSLFHKSSREPSIIVATDRNVLASLSARNGSVDTVSISNKDGYNIIRYWDTESGFLLWEHKVAEKTGSSNNNSNDVWPTIDILFAVDKSGIFVLLDGSDILKLSINDGQQLWKTTINENNSKTITFIRIVQYGAALQAVGLITTNNKSYAIEVITLDAIIGDILKKITLSSKVEDAKDVIVLGGETNSGFVVWKEEPNMRVNRLGTKDIDGAPLKALYGNVINSFSNANGPLEIINLNLGPRTEFLCQVPTKIGTAAAVFKIDPEGGRLAVLYDLEDRPGKSIYSATIDKTERLIVSRSLTLSKDSVKVEIVAPASRTILATHEIPHLLSESGTIQKSILNVINRQKEMVTYRILILSSDGSLYFWKDGTVSWRREESLAHAIQAEYLDLPERKLWSQEIDELAEQAEDSETISPFQRYIRRLITHLYQLQDLFSYIATYINHFVTGDYSSPSPFTSSHDKNQQGLYRDTFGFRKLLIFVTPKKLVALNTANKGEVVWSRYFGDYVTDLTQIFIVRTAMIKYPPVLVAIGMESELNAKIYKLPIEEPEERTHVLALVDKELKVYLYPETLGAVKAFKDFALSSPFYFTLIDAIGGKHLAGYRVELLQSNYTLPFESNLLWAISFPDDERIAAIAKRNPHEKVASLGRVLGDRSVLYKYLNPHLVAIATITSTKDMISSLNLYLIDVVKGTILYHSVHENVGSSYPVHIIQIENYILYYFWSEGEEGTSSTEKGFVTVVFDLYESANKDVRVDSSIFSSFAHERPYVSAQSFILPYAVKALGVTTTKHGIATREFLFALESDQLYGLLKRFLDPRRPLGPLTNEDKEEMLIPYEPVLPDSKQLYLSYNLTIAGIQHIITNPSLLESTSLVLAYGLDIFFTRVAPSKTFDVLSEDFSKSTLLTTIFGLILGIVITRPMVRRKNVNARWY
ncbi:4436_t:CDS:10 [Ambispora leptoticha]|uniref:ER membrane protein complex subunit 1 n=1 Tax=Ambispora leptoticha TaxID=144679 RepID=A0A9N8Z104_9GLOM|nr:4436_t:CDS:10 [Ambispora leptoticha]